MIHSEDGDIKWKGDNITLGAELSQLLHEFRKQEPEIFLAVLMTIADIGKERKNKKWSKQ